jgi:hypothetical protein
MFKLINFLEMPELNQLRHVMGAPLAKNIKTTMKISLLDEKYIKMLGVEGIEISSFDDIQPQKDKTLGYKGQRVLLYIRDINHYRESTNHHLPKFHVSLCKKLEEMIKSGRWQRYVVANRDDRFFSVNINNRGSEWLELKVCQYCLETLSWYGFSFRTMQSYQRKIIVSAFTVNGFFKKFPRSLFSIAPTHTSDTAPVNDYSKDWAAVSERLKREHDYKCSSSNCRIKLMGGDRKYLHVHHINGLKNDNTRSNLKVLCIRCHAHEPYHEHVKADVYYKEFITKFGN